MNQKLNQFFEENVELRNMQIRLILERDSTDADKIEEGNIILENLGIFRENIRRIWGVDYNK